eukprot:m.213454 g.213454  ORF g.213454 m.213454 type:complete len:151 (+) comp26152_c0_seq1:227-679(+)
MSLPCDNFREFRRVLQEQRRLDDNIVLSLNAAIPTSSFAKSSNARDQCMSLWNQLKDIHARREAEIKTCEAQAADVVLALQRQKHANETQQDLRAKQGKGKDNLEDADLRQAQNHHRLIKAELATEAVVRQQSEMVFRDRCMHFLGDMKL